MNKNYKYAATIAIRRIRHIDDQAKEAINTAKTARESIQADKDHSETWKSKRMNDVNQAEYTKIRELGGFITPLVKSVIASLDAMAADFSFSDVGFQSALNTISITGKVLPYPLQNNIIDNFKGNPLALKTLKVVYKKYELPNDAFAQLLVPFDPVDQEILLSAAGSAEAFATTNLAVPQWKLYEVLSHLKRYENALGLDTSVNPYAGEIKALSEETSNPMVTARINAFNRVYGEALEADEEDAINAAKSKLETGFEM